MLYLFAGTVGSEPWWKSKWTTTTPQTQRLTSRWWYLSWSIE
jgi:hypothetical protein